MDGWTFLKTIRSRPALASVPVIFQTALTTERDRLLGYQLGVDDYLEKPYSSKELILRINRLIKRTTDHNNGLKALKGNLEHVSLSTILSLLELEKKTGVITVKGAALCRLFIQNGQPLSLEIDNAPDDARQIDLAIELFSWKKGQFEFIPQKVSKTDQLNMSMQNLLIEAARTHDENSNSYKNKI
jgi:CheY-like chemotaxis protein